MCKQQQKFKKLAFVSTVVASKSAVLFDIPDRTQQALRPEPGNDDREISPTSTVVLLHTSATGEAITKMQ